MGRSHADESQLPPAHYLADATLADAICDRIIHNAHRLAARAKRTCHVPILREAP